MADFRKLGGKNL